MSLSRKTSIAATIARSALPFAALCALASIALAQEIVPLKPSGIYDLNEKAGWTIKPDQKPQANTRFTYTLKKNNSETIKSGDIDLAAGDASVNVQLDEPTMLYLALKPAPAADAASTTRPARPLVAGAAIAPTKLQPIAPRPADFDSFWQAKIAALKQVPENPVLTPAESGNPNVDLSVLKMDQLDGKHVWGHLAKPKKEGKFAALVIFQWASPPYPLQKSWSVGPAANGWLVLNVEPHDVPPDQPKSYYDSLPQAVKNYPSIGNDDRDKSYFLQMYLGDYRAIDYITSLADWDGKTLVVMGGSMGGQQSLALAGLHPKVTHAIVDEPAGCDTHGPLFGRQASYPNFPTNNPKIMETASYFDVINFAPNIKATCLVSMGFVDTTAAPAGIWTAFNLIKGPKEAVPMIESPHNNSSTPAQRQNWTTRSAQWLTALAKGDQVNPAMPTTPKTDAAPKSEAAPKFDDYKDMLQQLGVKSVRRGPDPNNQSTFDEAKANPYKDSMPDALKMNDGTKVTQADQWPKRRAQILEDFEREVYGRIPNDVPKVTWEVTATTPGDSGGIPIITKTLVGHVDNSACPQIKVDIQASFTVPAQAKEKVPVMMEFGGFFGMRPPRPGAASMPAFRPPPGVPWTQQAIAHGWGYGTINPNSIQPDNNQLTSGIIGLTNKGQPRKPDQWGALRAWQWGVSRLVDYFEQNPDSMVDPTKVGIEGVSRYGKAAIVTEAFDPRIAVAFVASSGEGGVKLHRHIFGEAVENLAGGEYYWMAGNFIKYGASDPEQTAADIPVDSHELIALCAPRPCFISYGLVEKGDAKWVDAHGSFMAGVLASPVYELLGKKGFGTAGDYLADPMPPTLTLIGGELAWRQHDGGHTASPNWPSFFDWVGQYIKSPYTPPATQPAAK